MKKLLKTTVAFFACIALSACGNTGDAQGNTKTSIKVGATSAPHAVILNEAKSYLKEKGFDMEVVEFADWARLNPSTSDHSLDANFFQHQPFLDGYNTDAGLTEGKDGHLVSVGAVHFEPLGIYSENPNGKTSISAEDVKDGDSIAIPNDATNEARALLLLEKYGIITLKQGVGVKATINDIESKVKNIEFYELDAAQIPTKLKDVTFAVVNGNYALDANITDKLICTEDKTDEAANVYANLLVVTEANKENKAVKALIEVLKSNDMKAFIEAKFDGVVIPAK